MKIGRNEAGPGNPVYVIGEIGINHNGDMGNVRKLIRAAAVAGCQAVKFQKRTVDVVYTPDELEKPRESPFGNTNGDLKRGLEFGPLEYKRIAVMCQEHGLDWFASCWDEQAIDDIAEFDPMAYKIASASITDQALVEKTAAQGKPVIMSTGMSTVAEIRNAVNWLRVAGVPFALLHTTSTYPTKTAELNLRMISTLKEWFPDAVIGYSGHELGLQTTLAAVALGACIVERHITLDRSMFGSDQSASVEPQGLCQLVRDIRVIEASLGDGIKRVFDSELPVLRKLRRGQSLTG